MKKCSKTLLGLALAAAMSLSLIVPASAVYCPHDYYASTAVWYTDDGPRLQTRHWQMTIRCHNCGYADAEKEHTFPVRLELPEGCSGVPQSAGDRLRPGGGMSRRSETKA